MRYVVIVGLAAAAGLLIRKKNEYRNAILLILGILIVTMSALYNIRDLSSLIELVRPFDQAFYQREYFEKGKYPDSLLVPLLEGKRVYVKDDAYMMGQPEQHGKTFNYALYHARNVYYLLEYLHTDLIKDAGMNDILVTDELVASEFASLGPINDMQRYCFLYGDLPFESANYFAYYWYYYEFLGQIQAYMCTETDANGDTVFTSDDLVILGNTVDGIEEEDLFIMTKEYYDSKYKTIGEASGNE